MKASEARKLTKKNLASPVIEIYADQVVEKIKEAATAGRFQLINPFSNLKDKDGGFTTLNSAELEAITKHFKAQGYTVIDHPDPDPGHPCSAPYTTLEW